MEFEGRMKKKIGGKFPDFGAIFMSNEFTKEECFNRKLFGLPNSYANFVRGVKIGMILFLFEYEKRELHGVFKATSDGELNIVPYAYSSSRRIFPAQVQRLLWLFDSRKIGLFQPNVVMENVRSNHFTMAQKKLKRGIDSVSHSNAEPLAYSGKSTVSKDESQLLDSGDSYIALEEFNNMHYNSSYYPDVPSSQSSLPFVASHIITSGQESGAYADHAIQSQPILIGEELKELNTSGIHDIDLGDYILLLPSDDSDSTDSRASPDPGGQTDDHTGLYEDTYQHVSVASPIAKLEENACSFNSPKANCQENNNSDFIRSHTPGRGLYSDASNNRGNVFSRLNFSAGIKDKEVDAKVDKSAQEIMEELQLMHDEWRKRVRRSTSFERQNGDGLNKRKSVFLRLSWTSETDIKDIGGPARSVERHDEHPW